MTAFSQTIFSDAFSWMKSFVFWLIFYWSLFLRLQLTIAQYWFSWWLGAEKATSHYLNHCCPHSLTHICGTRGEWVTRITEAHIYAWGRCAIVGTNDDLSPVWCQAIMWTNDCFSLIGSLGTNWNFLKMSAKWWPFCVRIYVLYYSCNSHM